MDELTLLRQLVRDIDQHPVDVGLRRAVQVQQQKGVVPTRLPREPVGNGTTVDEAHRRANLD